MWLLAGWPVTIPGVTVNRLCGSGMEAVVAAARAVRVGDAEVVIAGGVESMSRAPFVMPKADAAFSRSAEIHDTTIGWRRVNPRMREFHGVDSMPEAGENVAEAYAIDRGAQDAFALRSQQRASRALRQRPGILSPAHHIWWQESAPRNRRAGWKCSRSSAEPRGVRSIPPSASSLS
jgi:acetyl-CoA acetyltransferase